MLKTLLYLLTACLWAVGAAGCAGLRHNADYTSTVQHEALPLRSTVTVLLSRPTREALAKHPERAEHLRQSFQQALRSDLARNGPLSPVASDPEARLQLVIGKAEAKEIQVWVASWMIAPLWLFGVPMYWARVDLAATAELVNRRGEVVYRNSYQAGCRRLQGVYYGHQPLSYACPARQIAEQLREHLSLSRAQILAQIERSPRRLAKEVQPSPAPKPASTPPPVTPPRPSAPVVAVFLLRDMSGSLDEPTMNQLTEYLGVQLAGKLGFRVVPREQLRARLSEVKAESLQACYEESCQLELGKAVAAQKTVSSSFLKVGRRCVLNATVYDLLSETTDRAASAEMPCELEAMLDGVKEVVLKLAPGEAR